MASASSSATFSQAKSRTPGLVARFLALPGPARIAAGLGLLWALLVVLFSSIGFFDPAEEALLDWDQKCIASTAPGDGFALVAISRVPSDRPWPWPRLDFALVMRGLLPQMPQGVVFDPLLHDKDPRFSAFDQSFARLVDQAGYAVFAAAALQPPDGAPLPDGAVTLGDGGRKPHLPVFGSLLWPIATFAEGHPVGVANFSTEAGQPVRRLPLVFRVKDRLLPSLALAAAASRLGADWTKSDFHPGGEIVLRDAAGKALRHIPVDDEGRLRLRYRNPGFQPLKIPYDDFLVYVDQLERGVAPAVDLERFSGRQVWIGLTDPEAADMKDTILGRQPAVELQMQATAQIVRGEFLTSVPRPLVAFLFLVTGPLLACAAQRLPLARAVLFVAGVAGAIFAAGVGALLGADVCFPLAALVVLAGGALLCSRAAIVWEMRPEPAKVE